MDGWPLRAGLNELGPESSPESYSLHTLQKVDCLSRVHAYAYAFKGLWRGESLWTFWNRLSDLIWYENMKRAFYVPYFLNLLDLLVWVYIHTYTNVCVFLRLQISVLFCCCCFSVVVFCCCCCCFVVFLCFVFFLGVCYCLYVTCWHMLLAS